MIKSTCYRGTYNLISTVQYLDQQYRPLDCCDEDRLFFLVFLLKESQKGIARCQQHCSLTSPCAMLTFIISITIYQRRQASLLTPPSPFDSLQQFQFILMLLSPSFFARSAGKCHRGASHEFHKMRHFLADNDGSSSSLKSCGENNDNNGRSA